VTALVEIPFPPSRTLKQRWAHFIKQVYEVDPLLRPQCEGAIRIIAVVNQPAVIEEILSHLGLWAGSSHILPEAVAA
jgi:hypothetical protein